MEVGGSALLGCLRADNSGTCVLPGAVPIREAYRKTVTPLGDKTESFFSVSLPDDNPGPEGWLRTEYALPFSRFEANVGRFRSCLDAA